jgi:hypothetical protein
MVCTLFTNVILNFYSDIFCNRYWVCKLNKGFTSVILAFYSDSFPNRYWIHKLSKGYFKVVGIRKGQYMVADMQLKLVS